jgi:glycosyltransferase involved in cell wall biosynthesis
MARRVGLDLHVVDGKFQGSRTHVIELFSRVILISPEIEFFVYLDNPEALPSISNAFSAPNVHLVRMPAAGAVKRLYWDLPTLSRNCALDIIHTQYILPAPVGCRRVVTIHDILFVTHPDFFTLFFRVRQGLLLRNAVRRADHIVTVSEFSKNKISEHYDVPRDRISVAYNGVDYERFSVATPEDDLILARRKLVRGDYILSVGRLEPRKNHQTLIDAYASLKGTPPPLVIVGQRDFGFDGIFEQCKKLGLGDRIRIMEDVSDKELPVLYRNASVFAYPTLAEGFGMPVIEAMASGVPVVTTNCTAIPEITGGNCALLIDPLRADDLAAALERLLYDTSLRSTLVHAGLERARRFTWDEPARVLRSLYLSLL